MVKPWIGGRWVYCFTVSACKKCYGSLTVLGLEMTTGLPPFYSENVQEMYRNILYNKLLFPPGFSDLAQSFVSQVCSFISELDDC
jgi:hypothetical protein